MERNVYISYKTILLTILTIIGMYILYLVLPVFMVLILSFIIVVTMEHPIKFLMKQKVLNSYISRHTATILAYVLLIFSFLLILLIGLPPIYGQSEKLITNLAKILTELINTSNFNISNLNPDFTAITRNIFSTTVSVITILTNLLSVILISIYMSMDWPNIKTKFIQYFNPQTGQEIQETLEEIEISLGHWIKGQLTLMLIIGFVSYIGLNILQIEYPLALSLMAGLFEIVPVLGPLLTVILAGLIGFSESTTKGIAVVALFALIQQLENSYLVPKVMHKVSGFSPIVILISLLIGSTLFGAIGALLSLPIIMILVILLKKFLKYRPPIN